ncbi:DUF3718 domain-containing protein [Glaciecola sp. 1036]|uniref:DUF3718 domain-containing protein n=1 Tax=Alteromonadaceae TaxID=72275 RepID=UPI003D0224FE
MKKIIATSIFGAACIASAPANANLEDALANICEIVATDDKGELRKKMKNVQSNYNIRLKDYYSGITCSGNSLIKLAILNNSVEAGTLLVKKMPKKLLAEPEHDGSALTAWINEKGLQDAPLVKVLQERL